MSLGLNDVYQDPTIELNLPAALTADDIGRTVQPTANVNGSSQFNVNDALKAVLNTLDNGFAVWQSVQSKIGVAQAQVAAAKVQPTVSVARPAKALGLSTTQWLLIGGGVAALLVLPRLLRRA